MKTDPSTWDDVPPKVYLVWGNDYDSWVEATYTTKEAADAHAAVSGGSVEEQEVAEVAPGSIRLYHVKVTKGRWLNFRTEGDSLRCHLTPDWEGSTTLIFGEGPKRLSVDRHHPKRRTNKREDNWLIGEPDYVVAVTGADPEKVLAKALDEAGPLIREWEAHHSYEHEHPYETVEVPESEALPSGVLESYGGEFLLSFTSTFDPKSIGPREVPTTTRVVRGYDHEKRVRYVAPARRSTDA